ncbi:von willebrand factor type a domain protein [Pelomyxa schiedti]|nr:von willebrand factor type a domain protein [Pelomyxa schiedti]
MPNPTKTAEPSLPTPTASTPTTSIPTPTCTATSSSAEAQPVLVTSRDGTSMKVSRDKIGNAYIAIKPPSGNTRPSLDICCVIDVSGSMNEEATVHNQSGDIESHGLSILDIVMHAVRTIANTLSVEDRLAIVSYSYTAKIELPLVAMGTAGVTKVTAALEGLVADGATNLWDGLSTGLDILRSNKLGSRLQSVLLLTDGLPNIVPPRGHLPMLQRYKQQNGSIGLINTFGFGYAIDSKLLYDLSVEGNGIYSFIPDCSFVGTAFVNSIANLMATYASNVSLLLTPLNGARFATKSAVLGGHTVQTIPGSGISVKLGTLQFDQTKDIMVKLENAPYEGPCIAAKLSYSPIDTPPNSPAVDLIGEGAVTENGGDISFTYHRLSFVDAAREIVQSMQRGSETSLLAKAVTLLRRVADAARATLADSNDEKLALLLEDIEGQGMEAISRKDYYDRWGAHYLPALARAHLLQQCSNFKDVGIQVYGGPLFTEMRDIADGIFCRLPPPVPRPKKNATPASTSASTSSHAARASSTASTTAPASYYSTWDMTTYNCSSNPCFAGWCLVRMADGTSKHVSAVKCGDLVATSGEPKHVTCVVKTMCANREAHLVSLSQGKLYITPWHPVVHSGLWVFPAKLAAPQMLPCDAVYSFVIESDTSSFGVIVGDSLCATLGHGLRGPVIEHPYWGTQSVIDDLRCHPGWSQGLVILETGCVVKGSNGLAAHLKTVCAY